MLLRSIAVNIDHTFKLFLGACVQDSTSRRVNGDCTSKFGQTAGKVRAKQQQKLLANESYCTT